MTSLPNNFSWPLARKLASYCAQAYERADITDVATDAAAIVTLDGNDDIIVAFRGSRAARDFVQDAKVRFATLILDDNSVVETRSGDLCKSCSDLPVHDPSASDEKAPEDWRTPKAGAKLDGPIERASVLDCGSPLPLFIQTASGPVLQRSQSGGCCQGGVRQRVHEGFLQDFEAIELAVTSNVRTLLAMHPGARVFITGHSLGGALAILCAYEFTKQQLPVAGVYTFGGPRVGNAVFCQMYDAAAVGPASGLSQTSSLSPTSNSGKLETGTMPVLRDDAAALTGWKPVLRDLTWRLVNQNDLVPRLPGWLMGYRHCGQEIFVRPDGRAEANPALTEKFIWDAIGLYGAYRNREDVLIREHFLNAYQGQINQQLSTIN